MASLRRHFGHYRIGSSIMPTACPSCDFLAFAALWQRLKVARPTTKNGDFSSKRSRLRAARSGGNRLPPAAMPILHGLAALLSYKSINNVLHYYMTPVKSIVSTPFPLQKVNSETFLFSVVRTKRKLPPSKTEVLDFLIRL